MKPLVSILIPAYNAESTVAESIESALAQTWPRKEIIVVNDGSTDRTLDVAYQFVRSGVRVESTENRGICAAVNHAYSLSRGDFIQELDSDDILAPDKIELQLSALRARDSKRVLLSSPWAYFYCRTSRARFVPNSLWQDLSPVEWLIRKMGENLHMQNATWLVSRELAELAGPWDTNLHYDQDGEYFCRVLLASSGTRFVPEGRVFYRASGSGRISYVGKSNEKRESLLRSMKFHVESLRGLEDSERVRKVCLTYLQNWSHAFYPERLDMFAELQLMASQLNGHLETPALRRKYAWIKPIAGRKAAQWTQRTLPEVKLDISRFWDKLIFQFEARKSPLRANCTSVTDRES